MIVSLPKYVQQDLLTWLQTVISLLSYVVVVAMLASMAQQLYTIARWDEVKKRERQDSILEAGKTNFFDVGSDRVVKAMYYIRK